MEKGRIVPPGSPDWYRTVSFGDVIKIIGFMAAGGYMYADVKTSLTHETELRRMLEASTDKTATEIRANQKENTARWDQRFAESQQRDRELMTELKDRMNRIETKIDAINDRRRDLDTEARTRATGGRP